MTATIPSNDHGKIRVFAVNGPVPEGLFDKDPDALEATFGVTLDPDFVDVLNVADLDHMTLESYLHQGYDLPTDNVDAEALKDLRGVVVLIMSRAFGGAAVALDLAPGVHQVTILGEGAQLIQHRRLPDAGAKGVLTPDPTPKPAKSDARIGGMVATLVLIFLFALVGLMIWIAG